MAIIVGVLISFTLFKQKIKTIYIEEEEKCC